MKKMLLLALLVSVSLSLQAWENYDWLTGYNWFLEMDDKGPYGAIDWHNVPLGEFGKCLIPEGYTIYRRRLRNEMFYYLYQNPVETEKIYYLGMHTADEDEEDDTNEDDEFSLKMRDNNSYMSISRGFLLLGSGNRNGGQSDPGHPLVGVWGELPSLSDIRLVKPDNYCYYFIIDNKIPGFAVRSGTYLFRQTGDKVFETDNCFPDGYMRLEIVSPELLVLTPLFEKIPNEKGLIEPLLVRRGQPRKDRRQ